MFVLFKEGGVMILAFASDDERGLDGVLAYHFGRCPFYTFVEIEAEEVKNVVIEPNPYVDSHEPGVIPQYVAEKGAEAIFAGGMGARAQDWFARLGVKPVVGTYGKIKDIVEKYIGGQISAPEVTTVHKEQYHEKGESDEVERLKKELSHLREIVAELNERLKKLEKK